MGTRYTKSRQKSVNWNMSIVFKLAVCMGLFILPSAVLFFLYTGSLNDTIDFGSKEQTGTRFLLPLHVLAVDVPKFGQPELAPAIGAAREEMAKLYASYSVAMKLSTEELKSRNRGQIEPGAMLDLIDRYQTNPDPATADDLKNRVRASITHIGDVSNLILDPDLDSYYLMDVVLLAIPQTLYRIDSTRELLAKSRFDDLQAGVQAALFKQSDLARISDDLGTVFMEDANFYGVSPTLKPRMEPLGADFQAKGGLVLEALLHPEDTPAIESALQAYEKSLDSLWRAGLEELNALLGIRLASYQNRLMVGWSLTIGVLIIAIFLVILILHRILGQIKANGTFIHRLGQGDMSASVPKLSHDELGNMSVELGQLGGIWAGNIKEISKSSRHLKGSSHRLETTGSELIGLNDGLNTNIQGISAAIEELESNLASINGNVDRQFSLVAQSSDQLKEVKLAGDGTNSAVAEIDVQMERDRLSAHGGKKSIEESFTEVNQLSRDLGDIARLVQDLGSDIKGVQDIVDSITDISQRTSLLAMNAGIEAAHAGDLGKGFSVVAKEIQNLAGGVDASTKSISSRIKGLQANAENALAMAKRLNASSGRLEGRMAASTHTLDGIIQGIDALSVRVDKLKDTGAHQGKAVDKLVQHIDELRNFSALIREAVEEQTQGAREITQSVTSIKETTRTVKLTTEFVGELSSQMKLEGERLSGLISHYVLPTEPERRS